MAQSSKNRKYIDKVLFGDTVPGKSDLSHLSDMEPEDLETFKKEWEKVESTRRQAIVSKLVQLGSTNFTYDFSSIFHICLDDPDPGIKSKAIAGLTEEEDLLLISRLIRFVKEDSAEEVREAAVTALGKFAILAELRELSDKDSEAIYTTLLSVLKRKSESVAMRSKALVSIAAFHVPQIKTFIEEAYNNVNTYYRSSALKAMGRNCDPVWLDTLFKELDNDDMEIRYEAIVACGELNDDKAVPVLIGLTGDKNARIREAAIKSLGEIGGQKARATLNSLANNSKGRTREAALSAIKELEICEDFSSMDY